jgi:hypothetical protein
VPAELCGWVGGHWDAITGIRVSGTRDSENGHLLDAIEVSFECESQMPKQSSIKSSGERIVANDTERV